ncbi:MAG: DUF951 domain-containing protein [Anaerolineae bacterium]|nr:DUF951 domain-containing protein [Anaerolineae bacterium]
MKLAVGDVVRLRKQHPCGGFEWKITRIGADIGLQCQCCGRRIMVARSKIEKRIKSVNANPPGQLL